MAIDSFRGMALDEAAAAGSTVRRGGNYATRQVTAPLTAQAIDQTVLGIVDSVFRRALDALTRNRQTLDQGAGLLFERETLTEAKLREISATLTDLAHEPIGR